MQSTSVAQRYVAGAAVLVAVAMFCCMANGVECGVIETNETGDCKCSVGRREIRDCSCSHVYILTDMCECVCLCVKGKLKHRSAQCAHLVRYILRPRCIG